MIFQPNLIVNIVKPTIDYSRHQDEKPLPDTTHYIGDSKYPLSTPSNCSVILAHYSRHAREPFSGPVKKLTFGQLGSCEAPNVSPYESTCEIIEFDGLIHTASTPFEVVSQLPKVRKVSFFIGSTQQRAYPTNDYRHINSKTPVCPSVKCLKIKMNLEYFHSLQPAFIAQFNSTTTTYIDNCLSDIQHSLICRVEALLKYAGESFPNLKSLIIDLPENDRLCEAVQSLIQSCDGLRRKTQATLKNIMPIEKTTEVYPVEGTESFQGYFSWNMDGYSTKNTAVDQMKFADQFAPACSTPNDFYVDASVPEMDVLSPISHVQPYFIYFPQVFPMLHLRPPPGFAPLPCSRAKFILESDVTNAGATTNDMCCY